MKSFFKVENLFFIFFLALGTALITFSTNRQDEVLKGVVQSVLTIQLRLGQGAKAAVDFLGGFGELVTIRQRYNDLEKEMLYYRGMDRENIVIKEENLRLRTVLSMAGRLVYQYESANIIARSPDNAVALLVLDKGSTHGIVKNMSVIAYNSRDAIFGLVGRIVDVSEYSSRVQPIFDSSQHISARLERSRFLGLLSGEGREGFATLNYVDLTALDEIQVGDLVVTSGLNRVDGKVLEYQSHYPAGLYLGRIKAIKNSKTIGTSLSYQLTSVLRFDQIENVFIITEQSTYTGP